MSETPRKHHLQVPLYSRASDAKAFMGCPAQWILNYVHQPELPETVWFALGDAVHDTIEHVVLDDLDLDSALKHGRRILVRRLFEAENGMLETKKRNEKTVFPVFNELITNWFGDVHPDSEFRMDFYQELAWPPIVERVFVVPGGKYPFRSEVDAIFLPKGRKKSPAVIVDWKSGATAKAQDVQLWLYHYGLRLSDEKAYRNKEDQLRGAFHHLAARKLQFALPYPGDATMQEVLFWIEAQKQAGRFPPMPDWWCGYCRAKPYCPAFAEDKPKAMAEMRGILEQIEWLTEPLPIETEEDEDV